MKKSEEKPSCKVRVESGEKTFGVVVGNNRETISGIFQWDRWWLVMLGSGCQGLELIEGRWRCWWLVCYGNARETERGHFPTRQRLVLLELMMTGDIRQRLSRFGVERMKMEVLVSGDWCGTVLREKQRERERERLNFLFWRRGKGRVAG